MRAHPARGWMLGVLVLATSGCFVRAQGGYQTSAPLKDPGGPHAELSFGKSDFRQHGKPLAPVQYGLDVVAHTGPSGSRLGAGLSALWAPLSGWLFDWSPIVRLGGRPLQLEWESPPRPSISLVGEVGLAWFPSRHPTTRTVYTVSVGVEIFGHDGIRSFFQTRAHVLLGVTFEMPHDGPPRP